MSSVRPSAAPCRSPRVRKAYRGDVENLAPMPVPDPAFGVDPLPDHPAPDHPQGKLVLLRHGETEWSRSGRHTGRTDIPLTPRGEELARLAGALVTGYDFRLVLSSPLQRARRTAELAGLHAEVDPLLVEWDYGGYEGRTTKDIRAELGYDWSAFTHGVIRGETPGETVEEVAALTGATLLVGVLCLLFVLARG